MQNQVRVNEWVAMFREIGLDEEMMMRWHSVFETRYPQAHQSFLEWLGLEQGQIEESRGKCR